MKRFIIKTLVFLLVFAFALHTVAYILIFTKQYQTHVLGNEIYGAIANSKKKSKSKKLVMGDSVAQQLFDNKTSSDSLSSITCNQSISMAGQFLLLNNYLAAGNRPDTVFYVSTPFSFENNLDQIFTFQYFLKPFYKEEYIPLFTPTVKSKIEKVPYYKLSQYPLVITTNWSPEYVEKKDTGFNFLSPIAVEYLHKMTALAAQYNFKLIFLPTPTPESRRKEVEALNKSEYINNGLAAEFDHYFEKVHFIDDNNFIDKIHLKAPEAFSHTLLKSYTQ